VGVLEVVVVVVLVVVQSMCKVLEVLIVVLQAGLDTVNWVICEVSRQQGGPPFRFYMAEQERQRKVNTKSLGVSMKSKQWRGFAQAGGGKQREL